MNRTNIIYIFCMFFIIQSVFSQEYQKDIDISKKNPLTATLLGFIPGAGHFYLGDYKTGAKFVAITGILSSYTDFIGRNKKIIKQRNINFDFELILLSNDLEERGYLYQTETEFQENPLPRLLFGLELEKEREFRLLQSGQYFPLGILEGDYDLYFYETNPLIQYGNYSRVNKETIFYRDLKNSFFVTSVYSAYAVYRDFGSYENPSKKEETFMEVATSPFRWSSFKNYSVLMIPILATLPLSSRTDSIKTKIFLPLGQTNYFYVSSLIYDITYNAIWQEALFRGLMDHSLSKKFGNLTGILTTTFLFTAIQDPSRQEINTFIFGLYLSWISRIYNYNIQPGIFVQFWTNFIVNMINLTQKKTTIVESNYVELNNIKINSMPVTFYSKAF